MRQEILWVLRGGGGGVGGAQQGAFQAEGTAIPSPGLCLEASPGTCIFPGRVCVCVCAGAGSIPGWGGPHMLHDIGKKKKRLWPVCPVSQVGTGVESAGEISARQKCEAAEEKDGVFSGSTEWALSPNLSTAVDTASCWEHRAGDCSQILSNLKIESNCRMSRTRLL